MLPSKPIDLQLQNFCVQLCEEEIIIDEQQNMNHQVSDKSPLNHPLMHEYNSLEQDIIGFFAEQEKFEQKKSSQQVVSVIQQEHLFHDQNDSLECLKCLECREEDSKPSAATLSRLLKRKMFKKLRNKMNREKQYQACEVEVKPFTSNVEYEISVDPCSCAKTGCQKMYCECLARGKLCSVTCNCQGCKNKQPNELLLRSVKSIHSGKHDSHSTHRDRFRSQRYRDGCTCKKSQCLKKYCECYANGRTCGPGCMCEECMNIDDDEEDDENISQSDKPIIHGSSYNKSTVKIKNEFKQSVEVSNFKTDRQSIKFNSDKITPPQNFQFTLGGMVENTINCRLLNQFYINQMI